MSDGHPDETTSRRTLLTGVGGIAVAGVLGRYGLTHVAGTDSGSSGQPELAALQATTETAGVEWSRRYVPPGVEETTTPPGSQEKLIVRSVVQVPDGGFALAGNQRHVDGEGRDFFLLKTDAEGSLEWHERYGGDRYDTPQHLIRTADGGYLLVGVNGQAVEGTPEEGGTPMDTRFRAWALKTDAEGAREWGTVPTETRSIFSDVVQTAGGEYVLAGALVTQPNNYDNDTTAWGVRLAPDGTVVDQRTYGDTGAHTSFEAVAATGDGGAVFVGKRGKGAVLVGADADGAQRWLTTSRYPTGYAADVTRTTDGNYLITGRHHEPTRTETSQSSPEYTDTDSNAAIYLSLRGPDGSERWTQTYSAGAAEAGRSVVQTSDGGFAVAGTSTFYDGELVVGKVDSAGTEEWVATYDGVVQTGHDVGQVDGGYVVTTGETFTKVLGGEGVETPTATPEPTDTATDTPTATPDEECSLGTATPGDE